MLAKRISKLVLCTLLFCSTARADFVTSNSTLPATKTDSTPKPSGTPATQWLGAADFNTLMQAIYDLRTAITTGAYHGLLARSSDPLARSTYATSNYLWLSTIGDLKLNFAGTTNSIVYCLPTTTGDSCVWNADIGKWVRSTGLIIPFQPSVRNVIYVRPGGSDTTGDGLSTGTAFRTVQHALNTVPTVQSGGTYYYIDITGINDTNQQINIPPYISNSGVIGNGAAVANFLYEGYVTIAATPNILTSVNPGTTTFAADPVDGYVAVTDSSKSWTVDAYKGFPVLGDFGQYGVVEHNTATTLYTTTAALTGTVQVLQPGATLSGTIAGTTINISGTRAAVAFSGLYLTNTDMYTPPLTADGTSTIILQDVVMGAPWLGQNEPDGAIFIYGSNMTGWSGGTDLTDILLISANTTTIQGSRLVGCTPSITFGSFAGVTFDTVRFDLISNEFMTNVHVMNLGVTITKYASLQFVKVDNVAFTTSHQNPNGSGIMVYGGGTLDLVNDGGKIGGTGNNGYGLEVQNGGIVYFSSGHVPTSSDLTITGTMGDWRVGRRTGTWTALSGSHPTMTISDPSVGASISPNTGGEAVPLFDTFTTGGRPAATAVGVGVTIYDSTKNTFSLSNGTAWSDIASLSNLNTYAKPQIVTPQSFSDSATITLDLSATNSYYGTIAGNRTIAVSNMAAGSELRLQVIQGSGGSHTLTWPASFHWTGGSPPTLTTVAGQHDDVSCKSWSGSVMDCTFGPSNLSP